MKLFLDIISSLLLGSGFLFLTSPFFLYWWIHGDYERYLWIISGPYPYSHLGSGPFQLYLNAALLLSGILFLIIGILIRKYLFSSVSRH